VPEEVVQEVRRLPLVRAAVPAQGRLLRFSTGGGDNSGFFIAFEPGAATGAAMQRLGFDSPPPPGQVIAHYTIASHGDVIDVNGRQLTVVGTYRGGSPFGAFSFMNYDDAVELFGQPGFVTYVVVFLQNPSSAAEIAARIREMDPRIDALSRDDLDEFLGRELDSFLPVIAVLLVIAFLVGSAIVSLITYTATIERAGEYALLKALGSSNARLYRIVLAQSFIVGVCGFAIGVPAAVLFGVLVQELVPEFVTSLDWRPVVLVLGAVVGMSSLAAYLPARHVAYIEPGAVFRS
jgi:putative ABC transport system permease protein